MLLTRISIEQLIRRILGSPACMRVEWGPVLSVLGNILFLGIVAKP